MLNVHLHYIHDLALDPEGKLPFWGRYADNLVYLTQDVSEGHQARERAAEVLEQVGLSLKGPGSPVDLRTGEPVELLGLSLQVRDGDLTFKLGTDSYKALEESLEEAQTADDPPQTARQAVKGWAYARGPAFEDGMSALDRVLRLCANQGFRGILSREEIRTSWEAGYRSWRSLRGRRSLRGQQEPQHQIHG